MEQKLHRKLVEYIRENNPELTLLLEAEGKVEVFVRDKMAAINPLIKQANGVEYSPELEAACMELLTRDLRPSKFKYICKILEEEFETYYIQLRESDTFRLQVMDLLSACENVLEDLHFSEDNEDNQFIRYAIMGCISEYFANVSGE